MSLTTPTTTPLHTRYAALDVSRGIAIALMVIYHFSFDLNYFQLVNIDFSHDPFWLGSRTLILSLFLALMGTSLYLAAARRLSLRRYLRRLALLVLCAVLVSAGSYAIFPERMIFFGVLHFIAVASVLGLAFVRAGWLNAGLGVALIGLGITVQHPWFDQSALQWLGLMTHKPATEDYVPLLPWFGVVLLGMFLGSRLSDRTVPLRLMRWQAHAPLARALAFSGRHSLLIYMLHQPMLLAGLWLATA